MPVVSVWGIVVAAGSGSRFGGAKQYEMIGGRTVLDWSLHELQGVADGVVVVLPAADVDAWNAEHDDVEAVAGGSSRSGSVRAGLTLVPEDAHIVVVHDAARPFASTELGRRVVNAVKEGADAAVPGVPVADTIKRVDPTTSPARVLHTVDRTDVYAVQTPQAFNAAMLRQAHADAPEASDDAGLIERIGGTTVIVPGEPRNMKITVADDLAVAQILIEQVDK